ncbi:MAG: hypothetical protein J07HX5_00084, partial [halophilic archaeon J07HX5]
MTSYTRRGALAAIATGSLFLLVDTDAFESSEADREADVGIGDDGTALLGLTGVGSGIKTDPHNIRLTNRIEDTVDVTLSSQNNKFSFDLGGKSGNTITVRDLSSGDSTTVSVSPEETGTVSETINFEAVSQTGPESIELARTVTIERGRELATQCLFTDNKGKDLRTIGSTTDQSAAGPGQVQVEPTTLVSQQLN